MPRSPSARAPPRNFSKRSPSSTKRARCGVGRSSRSTRPTSPRTRRPCGKKRSKASRTCLSIVSGSAIPRSRKRSAVPARSRPARCRAGSGCRSVVGRLRTPTALTASSTRRTSTSSGPSARRRSRTSSPASRRSSRERLRAHSAACNSSGSTRARSRKSGIGAKAALGRPSGSPPRSMRSN